MINTKFMSMVTLTAKEDRDWTEALKNFKGRGFF